MTENHAGPRVTVAGLLEASFVLVGGCALAGYLARLWWPLELFCHFRVQYLWILMGATPWYLLRGRRRAALAAGVLTLVTLGEVLPAYLPNGSAGAPEGSWRAFLLNVHSSNSAYASVLELIRSEQPDVVVLEEVTHAWARALGDLEQEYPYSLWESREDNFGIALLSRLPLSGAAVRSFGSSGVPSLVAELQLGGHKFTLLATHPLPPIGGSRAHTRDRQLDALADFMGRLAGPGLLLGDLNCTPWSPVFQRLLRRGRLLDSRRGQGNQASWPAGFGPLRIPIDHALVTRQVRVHQRWIGTAVGSDHSPVLLDFSLAPSGEAAQEH